ncbi:hypothetical protein AMTRI_Chr04g248170 [Amborella trichopoda]
MASSFLILISSLIFISLPFPMVTATPLTDQYSNKTLSLPLFYRPLSYNSSNLQPPSSSGKFYHKLKASFKNRSGPHLSVTVGTPPRPQQMLLDIGGILTWIMHGNSNSSS